MGVRTSIVAGMTMLVVLVTRLHGEFWLGLEKIHRLTKRNVTKLRVDLGDFEGNTRYAKYDTFRVLDSSTNYRLDLSGYSGTAGDSLITSIHGNHNGQPFTTKDRDNDLAGENCAVTFGGMPIATVQTSMVAITVDLTYDSFTYE